MEMLAEEILLKKLEKMESKIDSMNETLSDIRVEQAVHEVKIGRSSAFFGAISGMLMAIVTAAIINFTITPSKTDQPKVIYKEKKKNEATL